MKNRSSTKIFLVAAVASFSLSATASPPKRIRAASLNKGEVHRIYLSPGLASVITFPCDVDEAVVGREQDLKVQVSPTTKRQLTLHLSTWAALHTNLLIRCGDKRDPFVFDVIVSHTTHQDVFKVRSFYGAPEDEETNANVIDSSERRSKAPKDVRSSRSVIDIKAPTLVEESK